jgi:flagellar biosynthesis/type III secretory pathway M-ring protein FliF/YscJ
MNAFRPAPSPGNPPVPSLTGWDEKDMESEESAGPIVPSTSRLSGKVRGLVARHPEETLNVLRRWMVDRTG